MFRIVFLVLIVPILGGYGINAYATSGLAGLFDNKSDSNLMCLFCQEMEI